MRLLLGLFVVALAESRKLINVVEACRHGARSPIVKHEWDTGIWPKGYGGELTPAGEHQHYLNGAVLRRRYVEEHGLLSPKYNSSEIYVRSTDYNRTIMSALSQLYALYPEGAQLHSSEMEQAAVPPFNVSNMQAVISELGMNALPNGFQPIPVHVVSKEYDLTLRAYDPLACPYFNEINNYIQNIGFSQQKAFKYENGLRHIIKTTLGTDVDYFQAWSIGDTLYSDWFHGYDFPPGITMDLFWEIMDNTNYTNYYQFTQSPDMYGARLASTKFFEDIINNFEAAMAGTSPVKFYFYSAHDTTLNGFLNGLEQFNYKNPPFASTLFFELYDEGNGGYTVRTLYNDQHLQLKGCSQPVYCDYYEFKAFLQSRIVPNIYKMCNVTYDYPGKQRGFLSDP